MRFWLRLHDSCHSHNQKAKVSPIQFDNENNHLDIKNTVLKAGFSLSYPIDKKISSGDFIFACEDADRKRGMPRLPADDLLVLHNVFEQDSEQPSPDGKAAFTPLLLRGPRFLHMRTHLLKTDEGSVAELFYQRRRSGGQGESWLKSTLDERFRTGLC